MHSKAIPAVKQRVEVELSLAADAGRVAERLLEYMISAEGDTDEDVAVHMRLRRPMSKIQASATRTKNSPTAVWRHLNHGGPCGNSSIWIRAYGNRASKSVRVATPVAKLHLLLRRVGIKRTAVAFSRHRRGSTCKGGCQEPAGPQTAHP